MKTICLTLYEWPDRTARCAAHLAERGIVNVEWVSGINAAVAGLDTANCYEVDNPGSGFRIGPKLTGVYLGHYLVWSICNALPDSHFLILEDDVILHPDFVARMEQAMKDVPADFDFLFLGSCCAAGKRQRHVQGEIFDVRYPLCNHAMVIAKKAMPVLLATQRKCYGPVDCVLAFHTFPHCKVYTQLPRSADQRDTELSP